MEETDPASCPGPVPAEVRRDWLYDSHTLFLTLFPLFVRICDQETLCKVKDLSVWNLERCI